MPTLNWTELRKVAKSSWRLFLGIGVALLLVLVLNAFTSTYTFQIASNTLGLGMAFFYFIERIRYEKTERIRGNHRERLGQIVEILETYLSSAQEFLFHPGTGAEMNRQKLTLQFQGIKLLKFAELLVEKGVISLSRAKPVIELVGYIERTALYSGSTGHIPATVELNRNFHLLRGRSLDAVYDLLMVSDW